MVSITVSNIALLVLTVTVAMAARDSSEMWGMKKRARGSDEDWGMKKRARGSDEDWGMKRARGSDEDWGMKKRARGSDEDWGMKKRARGSDEDWGMKKRARGSDEDWGMKKRARGSDEDWGMKRARGSDEDWGMKKRARGSDEDWGMKRARGSDEDWGMKKKRSQCARQGESCFSTEHCCTSYVCAASDVHELQPEVAGVCLHEKELTPCISDVTCKPAEHCAMINSNSYCVAGAQRPVVTATAVKPAAKTATLGLGAVCADSSDCQTQLASGEKLCCQKVSLGRQGNKQICDRASTTSSCISKSP